MTRIVLFNGLNILIADKTIMPLTEEQKRKIEEEERYRSQVIAPSHHSSKEKHGVPAILSFFLPGLGQMIKGQVGKGIGIFFGFAFSLILIFTVIGAIVPLIIWIWQIVDAYNN